MRYFGESSVSMYAHRILPVLWWLILVTALFGSLLLGVAIFSLDLGDPITHGVVQECAKSAMQTDPEWVEFTSQPLGVRLIVFPYLALITTLLLLVLGKSRHLFGNFRRNMVFHPENTATLTTISRLLIGFALLTANFTTLLVSLILLLVCEILRNGIVLQEEHDLTV
ncbi:MAG: hypothetical protein H6686_09370 [Fibrobacteria bacterium]|nr:hypothetical protein [Fibrobacteria bacterium]